MFEALNLGAHPKAQELITKITEGWKGIRPIHVASLDYDGNANELLYRGDLEGFLDDLTAVGINAVFVTSRKLSEDQFSGVIRPDGKRDDAEEVDLTTLVDGMSDYKIHMGEECDCHLRASLPEGVTLHLFLFEDWYREFDALLNEANEQLREMEEDAKAERRQAKENAEKMLLERLNALADDPAFRALRTHRAMISYAIERIEGLSELGEMKVKQAVALLADKIGLKRH
jgi:ElaB/YqjD/DUF883 family membrane-anchored ribosome-binding protein